MSLSLLPLPSPSLCFCLSLYVSVSLSFNKSKDNFQKVPTPGHFPALLKKLAFDVWKKRVIVVGFFFYDYSIQF